MRHHHIQMRFPASDMQQGMKFQYQGVEYTLGSPVPETLQPEGLPIGVLMNGYTKQFFITADGVPAGEAWFYYYGSFEGKQWAVLDELMLFGQLATA